MAKSVVVNCWERLKLVASIPPEKRGNVLLHGDSGVGKTRAALAMGLLPGEEVFYTGLHEEVSAAQLAGHWAQRASSFVFVKGPCLRAWAQPCARLILDEVGLAGGDALSLLLSILDDPEHARYTLPWGKVLRPSPRFSAFACMNANPNTLPTPLLERFTFVIHIDRPNPDALALLPPDIRALAEKRDPLADPARRNSLRTWHRYARLREQFGAKMAAMMLFGDRGSDLLDGGAVADSF